MKDCGRRIILDLAFEAALGETSQAIREEGLQTIARVDIRDQFRRDLAHDFRQYFLLEAWSPEMAFQALRADLDVGTFFPTRFAVYELADGRTAVVAAEPLSPLTLEPAWCREHPDLTAVAARESERAAGVLDRLQHRPARHAPSVPAA